MAYVGHKAIENSLNGHRFSRQVAEAQKRKIAKRDSNARSVDGGKLQLSPAKVWEIQRNRQRMNSIGDNSLMQRSTVHVIKSNSISGSQGEIAGAKEEHLVRKIQTIEKDIPRCINIEKLINQPMNKVN